MAADVIPFHARASARLRIKKLHEVGPQFGGRDAGFLAHDGEKLVIDLPNTALPPGNGFTGDAKQSGEALLGKRGGLPVPVGSEGVCGHDDSCNPFGHSTQGPSVTELVIGEKAAARYVTGMVTDIHKGAKRRLYLREHREARDISAPTMAGRMNMERTSILRLERQWNRCSPEKQKRYAAALGDDVDPEDLWRLPAPKREAVVDARIEALERQVADMAGKVKKTGT